MVEAVLSETNFPLPHLSGLRLAPRTRVLDPPTTCCRGALSVELHLHVLGIPIAGQLEPQILQIMPNPKICCPASYLDVQSHNPLTARDMIGQHGIIGVQMEPRWTTCV